MSDRSIESAWTRAFAKQALADLETRDLLARENAPPCHRLHFLQMGAEKLSKAALCQANGIEKLVLSHCVIADNLPILLKAYLPEQPRKRGRLQAEMKSLRRISREVETLSPSCDAAGVRPENVEYPWSQSAGNITAPVEYRFIDVLDESRDLTILVKLMRAAAEAYLA